MADESISALREAITKGDLQSLEQCLKTASIKTMLEFEKRHGESLLHLCVKLAGENCVPLVKRLLASGLVDGDLRDGKGKRFLECALASGGPVLVSALIKIHIDGLDDATGCYRMMKCGSLEVFQHYLTLQEERGWNKQDTFRNVASAMVQISVKRVPLSKELRVYLMWLLSNYGYRQLAGGWKDQKDPKDWTHQVATVVDYYRFVEENYDKRAYGDVDDNLLHRLEVIHNHLYIFKTKQFLRHLPLQEAVFCVAIFISIYRNDSQFHEYRLLVNKCFVIDVLGMVCRQLVAVEKHLVETEKELITLLNKHKPQDDVGTDRLIEAIRDVPHLKNAQNWINRIIAGRRRGQSVEATVAEAISNEKVDLQHLLKLNDRRVVRMLQKNYALTKSFYSLYKMMCCCNQYSALEDVDPLVWRAYTKRMVQVFGETMKNTKNTPNLPGKVEKAMFTILPQELLTISREMRDILTHRLSLKWFLVGTEYENKMFENINDNRLVMRTAFQLLYIIVTMEVRNIFYGQLKGCGTIENMRSLLLYAGDQEALAKLLQNCLGSIKKHVDEYRNLMTELYTCSIGNTATFKFVQHQLNRQANAIDEVQKVFNQNYTYQGVVRTCMASTDLASIRRLLSFSLHPHIHNKLVDIILFAWNTDPRESMYFELMDYRLKRYDPYVTANILMGNAVTLKSIEEFDYIVHTRQLTEDIGIAGRVSRRALKKLHEQLKPYYENIFVIDNKWRVLKAFCKGRKLGWNKERANELVKLDQERLQERFDGFRTELQEILAANHLSTVEDLSRKLHALPSHVLAAIEYYQLELYEMLMAVKYFEDNFHCMKHRIPMIQGKNFRNGLAHDALSYNILTDSSMEQFVVNAFVSANTEIRLFDKRKNRATQSDVLGESFPSVADTLLWVEKQEKSMAAVRAGDVPQMHALMRAGSEITSLFCCSPNDASVTRSLHKLTALVNPCTAKPAIVQFLDRYFSGFADSCSTPAHQITMALRMYDFQSAFDRLIGAGDLPIPEALFRWPELMASVSRTHLFVRSSRANRMSVLFNLIEQNNLTSLRVFLPFVDPFHDTHGVWLLNNAMRFGSRPITELLLDKIPVPHVDTLELAIIIRWNDFFAQLLDKVQLDSDAYGDLLTKAARAGNYAATVYLLEREAYRKYIPAVFEPCARMAACRGKLPILRRLLECHPVAHPLELATVLQIAALEQHWDCVRFLLDAGVLVDIICSVLRIEEKTTLLILVRYGKSRLLDKVTQVYRPIFGQIVEHPFTVALRHGTASDHMIHSLQRLGFDWLDSPTVMNEVILKSNERVLTTMWEKLQERWLKFQAKAERDHFALALNVLHRWAAIGFVEEPTTDATALICAARQHLEDIINLILERARTTRTIDGIGVLRSVVFEVNFMIIISGKRRTGRSLAFGLQAAATSMIKRMEGFTDLLETMQWHQCTIDASGVSVTVKVLAAIDQMFDQPSVLACTDQLNDSAPLHENLPVLQSIISRFFSKYPVVYARFDTTSSSARHFWQIDKQSFLFDILPPRAAIDLTTTVNYGDRFGFTPLHRCFPAGKLSLVKLLVENGANPLLANSCRMAAIHFSMLYADDNAIVWYLFDESFARDLRNANGHSMLDLVDGVGGSTLLHIAALLGRRDLIKRLFKFGFNPMAPNSEGMSAVHAVAKLPHRYNSEKIVKMLLDHDRSLIDSQNPLGDTLLHYAAYWNSDSLLRLLLEYNPKLTVRDDNGVTPLALAIVIRKVDFAKHLLRYAIDKGIKDLTKDDKIDLVFHSCFCNCYEFSEALLEYDLGHSLDSIEAGDLPRIDAILNGLPSENPEISLLQFVQQHELDEAEEFVTQLQVLRNSITDQSATGAE